MNFSEKKRAKQFLFFSNIRKTREEKLEAKGSLMNIIWTNSRVVYWPKEKVAAHATPFLGIYSTNY